MATFTEMVAAVVIHSSAAVFSHFGVTLEAQAEVRPPVAEQRVVARTPRKAIEKVEQRIEKTAPCPDSQRANLIKA